MGEPLSCNTPTTHETCQNKILRGAQIIAFKWGEITIKGTDNKTYIVRDALLHNVPSGVSRWDWSKNGTRHDPGILKADVVETLIGASPDTIIILSQGVDNVLQTAPETTVYLNQQKNDKLIKAYHILQTKEAIKLYNQLNEQGEHVVGLFHSTC